MTKPCSTSCSGCRWEHINEHHRDRGADRTGQRHSEGELRLVRHARKLPQELYKSLTWDRGKEMAAHKRFTIATDVKVYFCDPQSPWQRGSNENTNGLLRQYLPKGTNLSKLTQPQLDAIAAKLNTRPRRTLEFKTPADSLNAALR